MCTLNHPVTPKPGYLIDASIMSVAAPGAMFTRLLAHHREVGLTCEQIMALLDLNREYHDRQVAIQIEFARVTEMLEVKWGRVDEQAIAEREELLRRHAELLLEHERLFFEYARRGHEILTDEQIEKGEQIYHQEKDALLKSLHSSLNRAVAPHFQFVQLKDEWSDASVEALRSMARVPSH